MNGALRSGPAASRALATYLAARVLPALASMGFTFLCIRSLSAEAYGLYSLTLLPASLAANLIGGLSGQAMLRHAHELSPAALRRGLFGFPIVASLAIGPLVLLYTTWSIGLHVGTGIAAALIPLVAVMDTRRSFFVAHARPKSVLAMDMLRAGSALAIAWILFAVLGDGASVPLLAQWLAVALGVWLIRPPESFDEGQRGKREIDREYIGYGLWFAGWMATLAALSLAERSIVERLFGIAASGRYAAQADVVNAVFAATAGALASALMPRYLAVARSDDRHGWRPLLRFGWLGTGAAALLCLGLGLVLAWIRRGPVADALLGDPPAALALVGAAAAWTAAGFVQKPLELHGSTRTTCLAVLAAFAFFLVIAPFMGRWLGPAGVGAAKLSAGLALMLMTTLAARRSLLGRR